MRVRNSAGGYAAVLSAAAALASSPATAQDIAAPELFGWTLDSVRAGVRYAPDYMGSDDYKAWFTGAVVVTRRDAAPSPTGAPNDGVSLGLLGTGAVTAGVVGRWRSERESDNDLTGFEEIDPAVEAGAYVNWWATDWLRLRAELRRGFGGHESWVGDLMADAIYRDDRWILTAGPRIGWGDSDFTTTYFAVSPQDAARSPFALTPFSPDEDAWTPGVMVSAKYRLNPHWAIESIATYSRITGEAADSPIVEQLGSADQYGISLSARYTLGR